MIRYFFMLILTMCGAPGADIVEEHVESSGVRFRVVRISPERVSIAWKNEKGEPYRTFDHVQAAFAARGKSVKFIMNAGIFEPGGIPSGLHIEDGKTLRPFNLADAPGNFFLKPNGVCAFGGGKSFVGSCAEWQKRPPGADSWAIQSGPMLLLDGKRHPAFTQGSASKLHRNGVGVNTEGQFVFAITDKDELVNFWDFAGLFLKLGCNDALFLDGYISQMSTTPTQPVASNQFGVMFVVAE